MGKPSLSHPSLHTVWPWAILTKELQDTEEESQAAPHVAAALACTAPTRPDLGPSLTRDGLSTRAGGAGTRCRKQPSSAPTSALLSPNIHCDLSSSPKLPMSLATRGSLEELLRSEMWKGEQQQWVLTG